MWPRKIPRGDQLRKYSQKPSLNESFVKTLKYGSKQQFLRSAVLKMLENIEQLPGTERSPEALVKRAVRLYDEIEKEMRREPVPPQEDR